MFLDAYINNFTIFNNEYKWINYTKISALC